MELLGAMPWNSLNGIFTSENHDLHGLEFQANPNNHNHLNNATLSPSFELPFSNYCNGYGVDESCYSHGAYSDDHHHPVACCDTSYSSLALCEQEVSMRLHPDFYLQCLNQDMVITDQDASEIETPSKKRPRSTPTNSIDHDDQGGSKRKRNVKQRKDKTLEEENLKWPISPDSSSSSKDENSNSIHEELGGIASSSSPKGFAPPVSLNLDGKARASRGSASDPQSVYARKRREKINERLRTLQTLVPNGTKVDISTMLEDAVQYVKFLQLQIKLLSSDDLWMYAPLAYNGMNI